MLGSKLRSIILAYSLLGFAITATAATDASSYNYSHRMRDCELTVKKNGDVAASAEVSIKQIRNHFAFGGIMSRWLFDTLKAGVDGVTQNYGDAFLKYFDYATPENEMKWWWTEGDSTQVAPPVYTDADSIVNWCVENDITVRGHNLFWNEDPTKIPAWTHTLPPAEFKAAMQARITSILGHFKDRVFHWDVLNEIIHTAGGHVKIPGMFDSLSGDNNIFPWVIKQAKIEQPDLEVVVNDYNIIEQYPDVTEYINKINAIEAQGATIDVIGLEAHFNTYVEKNGAQGYLVNLNTLASAFPDKPIWLTEVDWNISDINQCPDKMAELMQTCFAHENVGGLILWTWVNRKMWQERMNNYLLDSLLVETETGRRWRELRESWKTNITETTDASGKIDFNGYQGKYVATITEGSQTFIDTFYLEPGSGAKTLEVNLVNPSTRIMESNADAKPVLKSLKFNNRMIDINMPLTTGEQLYLSTFSISGRLVSKRPVSMSNGIATVSASSSGCHIFSIGTADRILYTGTAMQLH